MKVRLTIDDVHIFEIGCADIASLIRCLPDDLPHAIMLSRFCEHPSSEVRCAIAAMNFMSSNVLEMLARDTCIKVVSRVACNHRALKYFQSPVILEMISRDVSIGLDIAENLAWIQDDVRVEVVQALLCHGDPTVVEIALNFMNDELQWRQGAIPHHLSWISSFEGEGCDECK